MRRFAFALLFCLLFTACGSEASSADATSDSATLPFDGAAEGLPPSPSRPALEIPGDAPSVIFLGDSISAGLHLPADEAFPAQLQRKLAEDGTTFRLVNAGVSGDTSAGGLRRLQWILKQEPDLVVIELGANDGLRGQPVEAIEDNLVKIVEGVQQAGAKALVLGMRIPTNFGPEYTEAFAGLYSAVGEKTGAPVVDFFMEGVAGNDKLNLPDGIHPTPAGHARLADNLVPTLREWLTAFETAK